MTDTPELPLDLPHGLDNRYLNNHEALAFLKAECDKLDESSEREYIIRVTRLYAVTKLLLDRFAEDGIIITPRVPTNTAIIDLLVRMPDKRIFALMVRTSEDNSVIWREDRQQFFLAKKGGTRASDSLTRSIADLHTIIDLRKRKDPLVGVTSVERNSPLIKAMVLAPGATISPKNPPHLLTTFGEAAEVLKIQASGTVYVVESENLIKFLLQPPKMAKNST
jgi:hypothetical protein